LRSNLGGPAVGKSLACNFALPPLVEFDQQVDAFDGLQMTLFAHPKNHQAVFETTFFPPGSYAITLPLYFGGHYQMMRAYRNSAYFTALVGSDPAGSVSAKSDPLFGRPIEWEPTTDDVRRMKDALATIVRMSREAGARRVWLPTHPVLDVKLDSSADQVLETMDRVIVNSSHINLATAHPQGGNMMAGPGIGQRVVDLDFRVRDTENLYVCDASVFPRGVRVNPQWTIMALASRAGEIISNA